MDFVTGLPWSNDHDAIWVVVDRLTKQRHLVPCRTTVDARDLADLFLQNVFRLHGLPLTITSDRGPQFSSAFWHRLCARLGVEPRLSTAFHPQTDGQTERINAVMEQYLRSYVNYLQDDWSEWLPLAEFASNNHTSETTAVSPFFANLGYDPRWQFDLTATAPHEPDDKGARSAVQALSEIHDHLRTEMHRAQLRYQENADEHRIPAPDYQEGDLVWLNARNWKTRRPSAKLDHRRHGPFRIIRRISPHAYRLELHDSMQVHPVFHVSLLEPAAQDPLPGQRQPPPPPVEIDGEQEWFVDSILDSRMYRRRLQYLVKWTGFDQTNWEPAENVDELEAVTRFHERYPQKPGPRSFAGAQR
jgi:transposase InsO family protein